MNALQDGHMERAPHRAGGSAPAHKVTALLALVAAAAMLVVIFLWPVVARLG